MDTIELIIRQIAFSVKRYRVRWNMWQGRTTVTTILILGNSRGGCVDELENKRAPSDNSVACCIDFR
jgi:hypothetical protein